MKATSIFSVVLILICFAFDAIVTCLLVATITNNLYFVTAILAICLIIITLLQLEQLHEIIDK